MEGESVLQMLAEISVAFAGFTGVVAALGSRSIGGWRPVDVIRFRTMVTFSLFTLGFALLPILLHHLGLAPRTYWAASSAVLALVLPLWQIRSRKLQLKYRVQQDPDFVPGFRLAAYALMFPTLVALVLNAMDVGLHRSFGGYLIGLCLLLFICCGMFVLLLRFVRFENADPGT